MIHRHRIGAALGVVALAAAGLLIVPATRSQAYVRSTDNNNVFLYQPGSCVWIAPEAGGSRDLTLDVVSATLGKAIANWQGVTLDKGCSYLKITEDPPTAGEAVVDYKNLVKFRSDKWCRPADPAVMAAENCFSPDATAITSVYYRIDPEGMIIDADIEMNEINFTFVVEPTTKAPRPNTKIADLENTLTHELGHFQGLDHSCWDHQAPHDKTPPLDNNGAPAPDCNTLMSLPLPQRLAVESATMFYTATAGEISKRQPKADDINGICTIYASNIDPRSCSRLSAVPKTGCSVGRATPAGATALLLLPLLGLLLRRPRP